MAGLLPIPGSKYTVVPGDYLRKISLLAYGTESRWREIYNANVGVFRAKNNPDLIYPGEIIYIPGDTAKNTPSTTNPPPNPYAKSEKNSIHFVVDGLEIPVLTMHRKSSIDSMEDECVTEIAWTPGLDPEIDKRCSLAGYKPMKLYIGPELVLTGKIYITKNSLKNDGRTKTLTAFSNTVDVIDSTFPPTVKEWYKSHFDTIAKDIVKGSDCKVTFPDGGRGMYFDYVENKLTETKGDTLKRLAKQSGLLGGNDQYGNFVFHDIRALKKLQVVAVLEEGKTLPEEMDIMINGRERFRIYTAIGQNGNGESITSTALDNDVPNSRQLVFTAEDVPKGASSTPAKWARSMRFIKVLTFPLSLSGWYTPDGSKLWAPGQMVRVKSVTMEIPDGINMIIREVEQIFEGSGLKTILSVCPPEALTGEPLTTPWAAL